MEYSVPQQPPDWRGPGMASGSRGGGETSLWSVMSDRFLGLRTAEKSVVMYMQGF